MARRRPGYPRLRASAKAAATLQYDRQKHGAPIVTAKGEGLTAERILALAKEHNVPIREDPALVAALMQLDVGDAIPYELYRVVAEVFAFIWRLDGRCDGADSTSNSALCIGIDPSPAPRAR